MYQNPQCYTKNPTIPPGEGKRDPRVSDSSFNTNVQECTVFHQGNVISLVISGTRNYKNLDSSMPKYSIIMPINLTPIYELG